MTKQNRDMQWELMEYRKSELSMKIGCSVPANSGQLSRPSTARGHREKVAIVFNGKRIAESRRIATASLSSTVNIKLTKKQESSRVRRLIIKRGLDSERRGSETSLKKMNNSRELALGGMWSFHLKELCCHDYQYDFVDREISCDQENIQSYSFSRTR